MEDISNSLAAFRTALADRQRHALEPLALRRRVTVLRRGIGALVNTH